MTMGEWWAYRAIPWLSVAAAILLVLVLAFCLPGRPAGSADLVHPAEAGAADPYAGFMRADGRTSCCGGRDCGPVPYDDRTGEIILPGNIRVDPYRWVNSNGSRPMIHYSFDAHAHACIASGALLVCVFLPLGQAGLQ